MNEERAMQTEYEARERAEYEARERAEVVSDDDDWMSSEAAICRYADAAGHNDPFDLGEYGHPHESGPDGHGQW